MTENVDYELVLTPPARRTLTVGLSEAVAAAVIDLLTMTVVNKPYRVSKPLRGDLVGVRSARRGTYRILYRIREETHEVVVLRVEHRGEAYRPH